MTSPRILVVDDDNVSRNRIAMILKTRFRDVCLAEDGAQGLELCGRIRFSLIVSDVMMPEMDGWTFVREVRSMPRMSLVPVIFLTSLNSTEDQLRGFRLGADDFLTKPVKPAQLLGTIERVLDKCRAMRRQLENPASAPAPRAPSGALDKPSLSGNLEQLGLSSLLSMLENNRRTGVLQLSRGDRRELARVIVSDGSVIAAEIKDRDQPRDEEAVYYLLSWSRGVFKFFNREVNVQARIGCSNTTLLLEGAKRIDEICSALGPDRAGTEEIRRAFTA